MGTFIKTFFYNIANFKLANNEITVNAVIFFLRNLAYVLAYYAIMGTYYALFLQDVI